MLQRAHGGNAMRCASSKASASRIRRLISDRRICLSSRFGRHLHIRRRAGAFLTMAQGIGIVPACPFNGPATGMFLSPPDHPVPSTRVTAQVRRMGGRSRCAGRCQGRRWATRHSSVVRSRCVACAWQFCRRSYTSKKRVCVGSLSDWHCRLSRINTFTPPSHPVN
jgi:hypothetical protein